MNDGYPSNPPVSGAQISARLAGQSPTIAGLTITRGTITTDLKVLDSSATWNNAAVTFTGIKLNVTDTASNAASLLMDLQVGGSSMLSITKLGGITAKNIVKSCYSPGTGNASLTIGEGRTGSGNSFLDLYSSVSVGDRLIRYGTDGDRFTFEHAGTGAFQIYNLDAAPIQLFTSATERLRVSSSGEVALYSTTDSSSKDTGALIIEGGIGCEKKMYCGGMITAPSITLKADSGGTAMFCDGRSSDDYAQWLFRKNDAATYTGSISVSPAAFTFNQGSSLSGCMQLIFPASAGQTALLVYDYDNAAIERVTVGAADSGGTGYKVLRIPN